MKSGNQAANEADAVPSLADLFRMMPAAFGPEVVDGALRFRNDASQQARAALNAAIDADGFAVRGFRRASKASPKLLGAPLLQAIDDGSRQLAGAVLRVWAESLPALRERVVERLSGNGQDASGPDYKEGLLRGVWEDEAWSSQLDAMTADNHPFGDNETTLMLILASGKSPAIEEDAVAAVETPLFKDWIAQLEALPLHAPEWRNVEAFATAVMQIAEKKDAELLSRALVYMEDLINEVQGDYEDELRYLEVDLSGWFDAVLGRLDQYGEAEPLVVELKERLASYRPVRPQGASREEERARSRAREEHEAAILRIVAEWETVTAPKPADADADAPAPAAETGEGRQEQDAQQSALKEAHGKVQRLEAEVARLDQAMAGVGHDKAQLGEEISELKRQLRESGERAEQWWQAYVEVKQGTQAQPGPLTSAATVSEAIERAQASFPDELIFALNSKSRTNTPFQRPEEVFRALAWLATEFRRLRLRPEAGRDFDKSIRASCSGWFYAANQSTVTKGQYPEWYEASVAGKLYDLSTHIGTGTGRDPRNIIRIAFDWDEAQRRVVVGFIGPHQRNSQS